MTGNQADGLSAALAAVAAEYGRAVRKFPPFRTAHEGWAVIHEEMVELFDEVRDKDTTRDLIAEEATQVAAMAVRFLTDLTGAEPAAPTADACRTAAAIAAIHAERRRQVEGEGFGPDHDAEHDDGALARAAVAYTLYGVLGYEQTAKAIWPWDSSWWKPKGRRRDLIRAAALIVAEIERLDREAAPDSSR